MIDIAALYSSRVGLEPGAPTFVGREATMRDLFRRLSNPAGIASVAILGPRRCGKTSLLKQLLLPAVRQRFNEEADRWDVAYLDLSSRPWRDFDSFRQLLLRSLAQCRGKELRPNPVESLEDVVRALVEGSTKPLIAILDEFDYIAAELRKDEQAELRGALGNVPQFAIVIGVTREPGNALEYIGDTVSDLAPVISLAFPTLGTLSEAEARQLVKVGRSAALLPEDPQTANALLDWAGRHPLLLHAACYAWYSIVNTKSWEELSEDQIQTAQKHVFQEVISQLPFVIRSLSPQARAFLTEEPGSEGLKKAAQQEIYELDLKSQALEKFTGVQQVPKTSAFNDPVEPVDELASAIDVLNRRHQLMIKRREFIFRPHPFTTNDGVYLRRAVKSEEDFKRVVEALARLLYDGSDAVVTPQLRGKVKPKLPKVCYRDPRSLLPHLVALRNYYVHIPTDNEALAEEHLCSAGDAFECYCGARAPSGPDFEHGRICLLNNAITLVHRLTEKLPLGDHLSADELFG